VSPILAIVPEPPARHPQPDWWVALPAYWREAFIAVLAMQNVDTEGWAR
jgi:hypothetical protein